MERGSHSAGVFSEALQAKMNAIADLFLHGRLQALMLARFVCRERRNASRLVKCDHEYLPWADDHP